MGTQCEEDIVGWSIEQVRFLRAGRFDLLDLEHLAEEIEDVGKREQRELDSRVSILLAHLLGWQCQPDRQGSSGRLAIRNQRRAILRRLEQTPSLQGRLSDPTWLDDVWNDATAQAAAETGLADFPESCPWALDELLDEAWFPGVLPKRTVLEACSKGMLARAEAMRILGFQWYGELLDALADAQIDRPIAADEDRATMVAHAKALLGQTEAGDEEPTDQPSGGQI